MKMALSIPWILSGLIITGLAFALFKKYKVALCLTLFVFIINWYFHSFAFGIYSTNCDAPTVRILSFNMNGDTEPCSAADKLQFIIEQDADVVYLAEDFYGVCVEVDSVLRAVYPYTTYDYNLSHYFYSKYPITKYNRFAGEVDERAAIVSAIVNVSGVTINVVGCHLSSNNYTKDFEDVRRLSTMDRLLGYVGSIGYSSELRLKEAEVIVDSLSSLPTIVMGDMNDVTGSPCMRVLEDAGLKDAWWEGGYGYGATIHQPLPYRIDHIMYSKGMKLRGIKKVNNNRLSDHDALVADFEIE